LLRQSVNADYEGRLYNFLRPMKIGCLNYENVKELVCKPMKKMNIEFENETDISKSIWEFTKGHPSIVQKLCQRLLDQLDEKRKRSIKMEYLENISRIGHKRKLKLSSSYTAVGFYEKLEWKKLPKNKQVAKENVLMEKVL